MTDEVCHTESPVDARVSLALVHHANQYLITTHYQNREGLNDVLTAYTRVLEMHRRYGIPVNLNISGTLIEACAWYHPDFLRLVRQLREEGTLTLIGGTYAENVMTLFPPEYNRRQLNELLWLYEQHFGCPPHEVKTCWVPERVWETASLAPVLADSGLKNGGYRRVILDDRILLPVGSVYLDSERAIFDSYGMHQQYYAEGFPDCAPYHKRGEHRLRPDRYAGLSSICRIADGSGLSAVPISTDLRYCVPPSSTAQWEDLERLVKGSNEHALLVYGDDFEKVAGAGPWDPASPARYEQFLIWLKSRQDASAVSLADTGEPAISKTLEPGAYYELSRAWGAGEDYRGWAENGGKTCCGYLESAHREVEATAEAGGDRRLLRLAWKHLLASGYETAWHDTTPGNVRVAPWARAVASHARASIVIAAAARWAADPAPTPGARVIDIDRDGENEVVLQNDRLFAVISPLYGGRITYLFGRAARGGVLIVGNPSDDWNWQEELNRYMDYPANHPGALADAGFEHERYRVASLSASPAGVFLTLTNITERSPLAGGEKRLALSAGCPALYISYHMPAGNISTGACLSPDYYRLLRYGAGELIPYDGDSWRGFLNGDTAAWLALGEGTDWTQPSAMVAGHGCNISIRSRSADFDFLIGCGSVNSGWAHSLLEEGRSSVTTGAARGAGEFV